jgi:glycosyltransferase involved in cell wall biosynthesis
MAFKKPSVVTDAGGNPEIVENTVTGIVTPNKDMQAFALAIISLLDAPEQRAILGNAAYDRYEEHFTSKSMAHQYESLYQKANAS